jgi:hypothetical protein
MSHENHEAAELNKAQEVGRVAVWYEGKRLGRSAQGAPVQKIKKQGLLSPTHQYPRLDC